MADLKASITAIRAISALALQQLLKPIVLIVIIFSAAAYLLTILLALSFSAWWWLLLIVLIPASLLLFAAGYVAWFLLQRLLPRQLNSHEKTKLRNFTNKILSVAERTKTPYPILLFLIAKDALKGKGSTFVGGLIGDSRDILKEFDDIQELFRK